MNITFIPTDSCNLSCNYCYQKYKTNTTISSEQIDSIMAFLFPYRLERLGSFLKPYDKNTHFIFDIFGGEPTIAIDKVEYFMSCINNLPIEYRPTDYEIRLSTNGLLCLTSAVKQFITKYKDIIILCLTLDYSENFHNAGRIDQAGNGSWDLALDAFNYYTSIGVKVETRATLHHANIKYLYDAYLGSISLGRKSCSVCLDTTSGDYSDEDCSEFKKQLELIGNFMLKRPDTAIPFVFNRSDTDITYDSLDAKSFSKCLSTGDTISIGPDGKFYTCEMALPCANSCSSFSLGDPQLGLSDAGLAEVQSINSIVESELAATNTKCATCDAGSICDYCPITNKINSSSYYKIHKCGCNMLAIMSAIMLKFFYKGLRNAFRINSPGITKEPELEQPNLDFKDLT